ncbi:starch phosphorylase [Fonticula alba]|uniref:Alpha-1,4 glucan phosphorylase n=1 Tax=Fonticula alba TaxID=691883 RepID=A0A058Z389_FONAL|nr:starch phosphorylase [Fonticula alba]KCV68586.1 starch phosphorylase [Fonticula alba]|eukprot:XP_009497018.1 starch phosphorylase [Fonticula alba]
MVPPPPSANTAVNYAKNEFEGNIMSSTEGDLKDDRMVFHDSHDTFLAGYNKSPPPGLLLRKIEKLSPRGPEDLPLDQSITEVDLSNIATLELWNKIRKDCESVDTSSIQRSFVNHVYSTLARTPYNLDEFGAYQAAAHSVRDQLIHKWISTQQHFTRSNPKRVYYLSLEFLMGRTMQNCVINMDMEEAYSKALREMGLAFETLYDQETDAALGNGGLGRLAACYMDSLATLDYPALGYGLRYTYGIFEQRIRNGEDQVEYPDYWLRFTNPWEVARVDVAYPVGFYGSVHNDSAGRAGQPGQPAARWEPAEFVQAVAYDVPIPGYDTDTVLNIRLWSSKPQRQFDLSSFNDGEYEKSVAEKQRAENITSVLYPNDNTPAGKELRLKQQYFFVCATLQDILRRFSKLNLPWSELPNKVGIQLNDTHPSLGIVELQRVLVDEHGLEWDIAWALVQRVYAYTNHTVLPEALECWPVSLMERLLPRHMRIIFDINLYFLRSVEQRFPGDYERLRRMSIIEEGHQQMVRMAYLAVVGSHTVNGVARIHSDLVRSKLFRDFAEFYGDDKFVNITNGITPRRWLHVANPQLSALITKRLGSNRWLKDLTELSRLKAFADDEDFQQEWRQVKRTRKESLAEYIQKHVDTAGEGPVNSEALFDVQVKRIHEYKRQLMNILGVVHRYLRIKEASAEERRDIVPRVFIFGGKAAPGYHTAKLIIKLINRVKNVINADPDAELRKLIRVVYIPNYSVTLAERIIPASDISEHISTAGTEASGTSNMKFVLNGGLLIGTRDGANVEIAEHIGGWDLAFEFGAKAEEVDDLRNKVRYLRPEIHPAFRRVVEAIKSGQFGDSSPFVNMLDRLVSDGDYYLITVDFPSYPEAQERVDAAYKDQKKWTRMSIENCAGMGFFSADRSVQDYAKKIWGINPCPPPPSK